VLQCVAIPISANVTANTQDKYACWKIPRSCLAAKLEFEFEFEFVVEIPRNLGFPIEWISGM